MRGGQSDWGLRLLCCAGELLTVAPWAAHKMPGLFALNERVVLAGDWKHGHFTYTAVGAFNVGSISLSLERTKVRAWPILPYSSLSKPVLGIANQQERTLLVW